MRYVVSMPEPHGHLFHVEVELDRPGDQAVLSFPVWTPGSYLIREFARHVEGFGAEDEAGRPLRTERIDKHRFAVHAAGAARAVVRFRVYANELTVRTSHLDGTHGYFNGANLLPWVDGRTQELHTLQLNPYPGWRVTTALAGGPNVFTARDYDELVDSPVEVGPHAVARFEAFGRPHTLAVHGEGKVDLERLARDVERVVNAVGGFFGGVPYERYVFIVHLTDKRRGGLEHAASTTLAVPRGAFFPQEEYEEVLSLVCHEYFHVWNVKRLRPAALAPYDYSREVYTRLLWWFEGVTSYYDQLLLARAGLIDGRRFLRHLGEALTALERNPGATKMSLEEASLTAWVKYYRPDENSGNSGVSYYTKGELVALALDLLLRRRGRSLDELVRLLVERHAAGGLPEDGVERALAELIGADGAARFLDRHVRGTGSLDLDLDLVGLRAGRRRAQSFEDKGGSPPKVNGARETPGWLGADLGPGAKTTVASVREGGPAWRAGLYADDEIVAEGGFRVDRSALWQRLLERGPGGRLQLTVFRRDALTEVEIPLGEAPEDAVWLEPVPEPSAAQQAAFTAWSGAPWPGR
jgi:predicted metalloprotease with PDZ domain